MSRLKPKLILIIDLTPIILPVWIMSIGISSMILLLFNSLNDLNAVIFGVLSFCLFNYLLFRKGLKKYKYPTRTRTFWNLALITGLFIWGLFNSYFASQHLITDRDPGVYANAGIWLIKHNSIVTQLVNPFGNVSGLINYTNGFNTQVLHGHTLVYAQGAHLLPVLLGLVGRLFGLKAIFLLNVWLGAIALLAIYGLARELIKPIWACILTGALAGSMPFIYFSRDTYTELLAALFIFASLSLLNLAIRSKRPALWFIFGAMSGAMCMARIDGYLVIAGYIAFLILHFTLGKSSTKIQKLYFAISYGLGCLLTGLIGWLDLLRLSYPYFISTLTEFREEIYLIAVLLIAALLVFLVLSFNKSILKFIDKYTINWRVQAAAYLVILATLILTTRPLWLRARNGFGLRSYAEFSTEWVSWYLGPIIALLGAIGAAMTASLINKKYMPLLSATFIVFLFTAVIYLINPNVAGDQIWASRRLVPVILPSVTIFAGLIISNVWENYLKNLDWALLYVPIALVALLLAPLITSRPLLLEHDTALLTTQKNICSSLPANAAVLWVGDGGTFFNQPTKTVCNRPSMSYGGIYNEEVPSSTELSLAASNAVAVGYTPILAIMGSDKTNLTSSEQQNLSLVEDYSYTKLNQTFLSAPLSHVQVTNAIYMSEINTNGTLSFL